MTGRRPAAAGRSRTSEEDGTAGGRLRPGNAGRALGATDRRRRLRRAGAAAVGLAVYALVSGLPAHAAAGKECVGRPATIVGTAGDDTIIGTPGPDVIAALGGNDTIDGGS